MSKSGPQPKQLPHSLRFDFFKGKNKGQLKKNMGQQCTTTVFNDGN